MAESEGFEPPDPFGSTVFKTAAFDRSASSPSYTRWGLQLIRQVHLTVQTALFTGSPARVRSMVGNRPETLAYYNHLRQ